MAARDTAEDLSAILGDEREGVKQLLRQRLIESGWKHQVGLLCVDAALQSKKEDITSDKLAKKVTPKAMELVPESVKQELLQKIINTLLAQKYAERCAEQNDSKNVQK